MSRVTLVQSSFNGGELSQLMDARIDQARYASGCSTLRNMLLEAHGAAYRRPGFQYLGHTGNQQTTSPQVRLLPFVFNEEQSYVLEFAPERLRIWHKGGLVRDPQSNAIIEVATPYTNVAVWALRHCQSADVLYLACPQLAPYRLERHGHADWRLAKVVFAPQVEPPQNAIITASSQSSEWSYYYHIVSVHKETDEESLPSKLLHIKGTHSLSNSCFTTLRWDAVKDAKEYRIYRSTGGTGNFGFIASVTSCNYEDRGQVADYSQGVAEHRNPFVAAGDFPSQVQFYQQRLCFASSANAPQTIWASSSGSYENLNISRPLRHDDACTITIASDKVNAIRWMLPTRKLLIGTGDGEWTLAGSSSEAFSPLSCEVERQSTRGSANIFPLTAGDSILYVQRGGRLIRELGYNQDIEGHSGTDITVLAEHLFQNRRIIDWAWQQQPNSTVWCVLDDGSLAAMTLIKEHEISAWHWHDTQGVVESVCTIPGEKGDELWAVVCREVIDPETKKMQLQRYIERLAHPFTEETAHTAFFVDSGLSYSGTPAQYLWGLEHLEGREVQILADAQVHRPQTVVNGGLTLDMPASDIHIGLQYISDLAPMPAEPPNAAGSTIGIPRRVVRARVRLLRSLGVTIGPDAEHLHELLAQPAMPYLGQAQDLFTGDKQISIAAQHGTGPSILLRQDNPLPFTLRALVQEVEVSSV